MKSVAILLATTLLIAGCAKSSPDVAVSPGFTFHTLTQNQTLHTAMPALNRCGEEQPNAERSCPLKETLIAGAQSQDAAALFDRSGFRELRVSWETADYARVTHDLTQAYGEPRSLETKSLRTAHYTTVDNIVTTWCFSGGQLTLEKYADQFTVTRLSYLSSPRTAKSTSI